jgi:hypothetical protein
VTRKDTGLTYKPKPEYPDKKSYVTKAQGYDFSYRVQDKWARLYMVDIYNLDLHVKGAGPTVPASLRGLWWMDGNPLPEVVLSFAESFIDKTTGYLKNPYNGQNS